MILDSTLRWLHATLSANPLVALPWTVSYADVAGGHLLTGQLGNTVVQTLLSGAARARTVIGVSIVNRSTVDATVTVGLSDNGADRTLVAVTLAAGDALQYQDTRGWYVLDANGQGKGVIPFPFSYAAGAEAADLSGSLAMGEVSDTVRTYTPDTVQPLSLTPDGHLRTVAAPPVDDLTFFGNLFDFTADLDWTTKPPSW